MSSWDDRVRIQPVQITLTAAAVVLLDETCEDLGCSREMFIVEACKRWSADSLRSD